MLSNQNVVIFESRACLLNSCSNMKGGGVDSSSFTFFFFKTRAIMLLAHRCQSTHLTHTTSSCFFPTRIFNPGTPLCRARIWHVLSFLNELRSIPLLNNALKKCTTSFWASISIDLGKTLFCVLMLTSLGVWNIVKGSIG